MANEARSAELAITSLISNKRKWNNCFIKFLKLREFGSTKYERKKRENGSKSKKNIVKMQCCVIPGGQTDEGKSQHSLQCRRILSARVHIVILSHLSKIW